MSNKQTLVITIDEEEGENLKDHLANVSPEAIIETIEERRNRTAACLFGSIAQRINGELDIAKGSPQMRDNQIFVSEAIYAAIKRNIKHV